MFGECYFSLYCCDLSCYMHHGLLLVTLFAPCCCMQNVGGALTKCVQRHLRPLRLKMHTLVGALFYLLGYTLLLLFNQMVLSSITKKREIESASRPLINFGYYDINNLDGLMLSMRCL
jgi:hypothetical protein